MAVLFKWGRAVCDTEAERQIYWPEGTFAFCKDTKNAYLLTGGVFYYVGNQAAAAGAVARQTEVDFGATPVADGTFLVTEAFSTPTSKIVAQLAYEAPTGKDLDETEMDDLLIRCKPGSGQLTMFIEAADGSYLADKFKINYTVG